jgi:phosphatidylserine decarboxylase
MVKDGIYYGVGFTAAGLLIGFVFGWLWALPLFVLAAFCANFFRDPDRVDPGGDVAVSPADGKVVHVRPQPDGGVRISIFLNLFNVHVNRVPVAGVLRSIEYKPGIFVMAHKETASEENEQNVLVIDPDDARGGEVVIRQIAGLVARRIVCYKKTGDRVERGERFGMMKFSSRMDVFLGPQWQLTVKEGDHVSGGSSVLARLSTEAMGAADDE